MFMAPARGSTIVALSSGRPPAGVAIVRVSGPTALCAAGRLAGDLPAPRRMSLRTLRNPESDVILDRAMVAVFAAPATATGEDVAEFHLHGGVAVVSGVIEALLALPDVRLAEAGEFTRRAYDNGRIDLAQAEAIGDLVSAETTSQRDLALAMAGGALGRAAEALRERIVGLLAGIEAEIDFGEDEADVVAQMAEQRAPVLSEVIAEIDRLLREAGRATQIRDGLTIAVIGPPNAGKSSLVNALTMSEAAIVSDIPGTTRDAIVVPLDLGGIAAVMIDTAGLRQSDDPVEQEGMRRARARAAAADLVLHVADTPPAQHLGQVVISKTDLGTSVPKGAIGVSTYDSAAVDRLRLWLANWARTTLKLDEPPMVVNSRHREAFIEARGFLFEAAEAPDPVLAAAALRLSAGAIGRITGRVGVEDILDTLFSRFCIGK